MRLQEVMCGARFPCCVLLLPLLFFTALGSAPGVMRSCCHGDSIVEHGQVVLSLPTCCLTLVCVHGVILPNYHPRPEAMHCCEFDGLMYPDGAQLTAQCFLLTCRRGVWSPTHRIEDCCKHCYLYNDPHIRTFDDYRYDWHGTCNYSVAQSDFTYKPDVGIFSDFESCNGRASCLAHTTFKDNPHTAITIWSEDVFNLVVNGDTYVVPVAGAHAVQSDGVNHPVLAWRDGGCVYLLGSSKLVVQHCRHRLDVWAYPSLVNQLDGLCGHYNFYQDDDFTSRTMEVHPLQYWPSAFPESWRTNEQMDPRCEGPCLGCWRDRAEDPCKAEENQRKEYTATCRRLLHPIIATDTDLVSHVEACALDLCVMRQNGATQAEVDYWSWQMQVIVQQTKIIIAKTLTGWVPNASPVPAVGMCVPGSRWMNECNWCFCNDKGVGACTEKGCFPEYEHELGEKFCENGSIWRRDSCNWCECVGDGAICTHHNCDFHNK
ncbi:von Willebrand factor-like [Homarus americanus]|uniref:von Willebrand factor-like n=1 Tax=Homarus americanus TaxID=6706 RepID=UPI001C4619A6|nr:von Willebrand factor-like [Homarus americanus]